MTRRDGDSKWFSPLPWMATLVMVAGAATAQGDSSWLRKGVVIEAEAGILFMMAPSGSVEAYEIESGRELWRSDAAAMPLALYDDRLLALVDPGEPSSRLTISVLDPASGEPTGRAGLALADPVKVSVDDGLHASFDLEADGPGSFSWSYDFRHVSGAVAEQRDEGVRRRGRARFDVEGSRLTAIPVIPAPLSEPLLVDAAWTRTLPDVSGRAFRSQDRRHVLISERRDDGVPARRYRWTIFDADGEQRLGTIDAAVSWSPWLVVKGHIVLESPEIAFSEAGRWRHEPLAIRVVRLTTGRELWRRELRQTIYRGPFPH